MSHTQFANLVSSFNIEPGIPVTIRRLNGKSMEECPFKDRGAMHMDEYREHLAKQTELTSELIRKTRELLEAKKTFTKADKKELLDMLLALDNEIRPNEEYMVEAFQEQMDTTTQEAKAEIEAFFENRVRKIAQAALVENADEFKKITENPIDI